MKRLVIVSESGKVIYPFPSGDDTSHNLLRGVVAEGAIGTIPAFTPISLGNGDIAAYLGDAFEKANLVRESLRTDTYKDMGPTIPLVPAYKLTSVRDIPHAGDRGIARSALEVLGVQTGRFAKKKEAA